MDIIIPCEVAYIIDTLESGGFGAHAVGGCVRDSLLGKTPQDWDICTSAFPEQTKKCFAGQHIIETGLKHGTVTLMLGHKPFEVTTYRIDGKYTDSRRPDEVFFVGELEMDLARRDFTINAMAYNPKTGLADHHGGERDLAGGIIRCVGDAGRRFREDALRIMRALRFASVFGFSIEDETARAMHENKALLHSIAAERIAAELNKLITGDGVGGVLSAHLPVLTEVIPEIAPMVGFEQNNPWHYLDVWQHTLAAVTNAAPDIVLRLAVLFHDLGKPKKYSEDEDGVGHFYGHSQVGHDMAKEILQRLKYDSNTISAVTQLILYHDAEIVPRRGNIKRWLNRLGEERFLQLLEIKRADNRAQSAALAQKKLEMLDETKTLFDEIIGQRQCFRQRDLAVKGDDLIAIGIPEGPQIGIMLTRLTELVIDEQAENDRAALLEIVRKKLSDF